MSTIFILGAGSAGSGMAVASRNAGIDVLGLWTRSSSRSENASKELGLPVHHSRWPEAIRSADIVLVAVSDTAIHELALELADNDVLAQPQVVLHMCGALGPDALSPLETSVRGTGVLHPLYPFRLPFDSAGMSGVGFGVDGNPSAVEAAEMLASELGGFSFRLPQEKNRGAYHAGASVAGNFVTTLLWFGTRLLSEAGIDEKDALKSLVPLARAAVGNAEVELPAKALTGPFRRGDLQTVRSHIEAVRSLGSSELSAYAALGVLTLAVAREGGKTPDHLLKAIEDLLMELV